MKHKATLSWSLAVASVACLGSQVAFARSHANMSAMTSDADAGTSQMVPAEAMLAKPLELGKAQAGQTVEAKLSDGVHLKNGTDLPRGTELVGTVVTDQPGTSGANQVALRFDQAKLKNGTSVPVKVMIVGMAKPVIDVAGNVEPTINPWTDSTSKIDQVDVLPGVDLHSNISSDNSGVLATTKSDMRLGRNIQICLAIGPQGNS